MSKENFSDAIVGMRDLIKKEASLGKGGVLEISSDLYEKTLQFSDGLDMETVEKVKNHTSNLVSAAGLATGELGIKAFKKDDKLDQVSLSFPGGIGRHSVVFQRQRDVPVNAPGEPRRTETRYGLLTSGVTVYGAEAKKGSLKKVREHLMAEAARVLAG